MVGGCLAARAHRIMSNPDLFLIVWLIGVLLVWPPRFWVSVRSRRVRGEPIIPRPPANASFCERRASGSLKNTLGGARNCQMVCVVGDSLWITPTFPFNMIAPYGLLGMEHRIVRDEIISLQFHNAWLATWSWWSSGGRTPGRSCLNSGCATPMGSSLRSG